MRMDAEEISDDIFDLLCHGLCMNELLCFALSFPLCLSLTHRCLDVHLKINKKRR